MDFQWEWILRLCVAGLLGAFIGMDREYRAKEAGYRTHFLISLGSALFTLVSIYGFEAYAAKTGVQIDPSRLAAQIVTGIGFLGAGSIVIQKYFVRGLTTAAGIWATAGIGLCVGCGMYALGIAATILVLLGLEVFQKAFKNSETRPYVIVFSTSHVDQVPDVISRFEKMKFKIISYELSRQNENSPRYSVSLVLNGRNLTDENQLLSFLKEFPDITLEKLA